MKVILNATKYTFAEKQLKQMTKILNSAILYPSCAF